MIQFYAARKKNMTDGSVKYYPHVANTQPVSRAEIIRAVEKVTSLSASDVKSCLDALEYQIIEHLRQGHSVRLGDLGSFRPTLNAYTYDNRDEVNAAGIKRVRVRFTPSGEMVRQLAVQNVGFQRVDAPAEPPADENE